MGAAGFSAARDNDAAQKRTSIIEAATRLFLDSGYDGTSLARIAKGAGVSRATLFKQFTTKAVLFEAMVTEYWKVDDEEAPLPEPGSLRAGVRRYLAAENAAGTARLDDAEIAATQFLGMISNFVFWPRMLLARGEPDDSAVTNAVDQAVLTMLARYGAPGTHGT